MSRKTSFRNQNTIHQSPYIMEIKIQSIQFIKPSKPTPHNLHDFKLSRLDQLAPLAYINMILYYKTTGAVHDRCGQLIKSLSEALNLYYPLAGRITQDTLVVDCSDQGVQYVETQVSTRLEDFLSHGPKIDQLVGAPELVTNALVTVQVNVFDCGSLVIGVSASHKVTDADSLVRFINEWASMNRTGTGCSNGAYSLSLDSLATLFPPMEISSLDQQLPVISNRRATVDQQTMIIMKRLVFNRAAISNLRAKAGSENSKLSRVTLVSSLIWKALIAFDRVKSGRFRDCLLAPAITLRGKTGSQISESAFGNIWIPYPIRFLPNGTDCEFLDLVALIDETTRNTTNWLSKASGEEICTRAKASYDEVFEEIKQNKFSIITSWCRFPIYEADFGWGKPYWTSPAGCFHDMVILMDDKDGDGIEAWVSLNEKDMHLFEQDEDVIAFSS